MSAQDNLQPTQFYGYHVSPYLLKTGDKIRPGGKPANFDNDTSGTHSYMTDDPDRAQYYDYMLHERGYETRQTYEVSAPARGVKPDPVSGDENDFRTKGSLTVLGKVRGTGPRGGYWPPETR